MFKLDSVTKRYGDSHAVGPIDLSIAPGGVTAVIGPSGCGKSTLLKLMIGLIEPESGLVSFDGAWVTHAGVEDMRRRMGYVIQDGGLFPHLTARRNIALMARYLGQAQGDIDARLKTLCDMTHFPAEALDPIIRHGLQGELRALFRSLKKTVVLVTHDIGEAGFFADDIVLMNEGRIAQQGSLRDLVERPASDFVTSFVAAERTVSDALGKVTTP